MTKAKQSGAFKGHRFPPEIMVLSQILRVVVVRQAVDAIMLRAREPLKCG